MGKLLSAFESAVQELHDLVEHANLPTTEETGPANPVCSECIVSDYRGQCCFDILKPGEILRTQIPWDCPKGINASVSHHNCKKYGNGLTFFGLAFMGELEHRGPLGLGDFKELFPYLEKKNIERILGRLRGQGQVHIARNKTWRLGQWGVRP